MSGGEIFLGLGDFGSLEVADFGRESLDTAGDHPEGREEGGVAIAGNDLGREGLWLQAESFGDIFLDIWRQVGEGSDGSGNFAGGDFGAGGQQPLVVALEFGVEAGEFQAKGHWLGMDAVRAADHDRVLEFVGAAVENCQQNLDIVEQNIRRLGQLHGKTSVQYIRTGHALVEVARLRPDMFGEVGQEGDDIVAGLLFDLVDAHRIENQFRGEIGAGANHFRHFGGDEAKLGHLFGGENFDLEPDAEAIFGLPQGGHFGATITKKHGNLCRTRVESSHSIVPPPQGYQSKLVPTAKISFIGITPTKLNCKHIKNKKTKD